MQLKLSSLVVAASAAVLSLGAVALAVQDNGAPPMAQASPEHKVVLERVGTWDATLQLWMGPGEPQKMKGVETNRALGDLHVVSEFKSEFMGFPFEGLGVLSWDPAKKKFISFWTDVTEPSPQWMEGTYDAKTRTLTFTGENVMMGERTKMRHVATIKDADHSTFEMFSTGPDGKETKSMQIDYTRRK